MTKCDFVVQVNGKEYVSKLKQGWLGVKIETSTSFFDAYKFTKENAQKLVEQRFSSRKLQGKAIEITYKKTEYSQFYFIDTYLGEKCVKDEFFGDVFNMRGRYAIELRDGKRLTLDTKYSMLSATNDPVFFLRFKDKEEAQSLIRFYLNKNIEYKVVEVPEMDVSIGYSFGFKRLEAENDYELDRMLNAYISCGWQLHGERSNDYFKVSQTIVKEEL
ncbi:CTP synthetase [Weissella phage WCP30]|uniref:CTP synthetase n=1 Tax=Weissella phage WCP30 TaxID=1837862 RepID=UPI000810FC93|nr:CTP synthetase [Weissella phage WCP30]ANU78877.1 CTP synthetase [Weissella phage WCP30]